MFSQGIGTTLIGQKRTNNEDFFVADNDLQLFVVSDGMGGHASGEVASSTAVEAVVSYLKNYESDIEKWRSDETSIDRVVELVKSAIETASQRVFELSVLPENTGMGCTLTLLLFSGSKAVMGHVGDSRLYLLRGGVAHQMSQDHTMAQELVRSGIIKPEEAVTHRYANVLTRAIGPQTSVNSDTLVIDLSPGDRFLLCSDGFSEYVTDESWLAQHMSGKELDDLADDLANFANDSGGKDNITVVLIDIAGEEEPIHPHVDVERLRHVPIFDALSFAQASRVQNHGSITVYKPNETLFKMGETLDTLFVILSGKANVGDNTFETGAFFGASTLLRPRAAKATATAETVTMVFELRYDRFRHLCNTRPWLGVKALRRLGEHLSLQKPEYV